jgi:hypothetical protein
MGGAAVDVGEPIVTTVQVQVGSVCVWDHGTRLLPLHGFVTYRYCPTCSLEHVFFAERMTEESIEYHSYFGNHRVVVGRSKK